MAADLRQRGARQENPPDATAHNLNGSADTASSKDAHPSGKESYGRLMQALRGFSFGIYFASCTLAVHLTQILGSPLYWVNRDLYYSYMALTKQSFGLLVTTMTHWWSPTTIRISGDASVAGQIGKTSDGRVEFSFPERMVMIANHQLYTDWLYLWWVGYANNPRMHGYLYIILKESLKYIPVIGPGMMFYGFIFMSRKMAVDQPRLAYRLGKLKEWHTAPDGNQYRDPMWLLLFPEGTNASQNGKDKSAQWARKTGVEDTKHMLLPRSTGMFFCLGELKGSVEYVYDCTVAYEGIPYVEIIPFGEQYFSLSSTYFQGRPPKSVNFFWRRFKVDDIPLEDSAAFDAWLHDRWHEKDALMEEYLVTGRFPPSPTDKSANSSQGGFVETEVRTRYWWEFIQIFAVLGIFGLLGNLLSKTWGRFMSALS